MMILTKYTVLSPFLSVLSVKNWLTSVSEKKVCLWSIITPVSSYAYSSTLSQ